MKPDAQVPLDHSNGEREGAGRETAGTKDIELLKLELEQERIRSEVALRKQEIALQKMWRLAVTVATAFIGVIGTIAVASLEGDYTAELENKKFESTLILQATREEDPLKRAANLKFLVSVGLLQDPDNRIQNLANKAYEIPFFPAQQMYGRGSARGGADIQCTCEGGTLECTARGPLFEKGVLYDESTAFARDVAELLSFHQDSYGDNAIEKVEAYGYADGFDEVYLKDMPSGSEIPRECALPSAAPLGAQQIAEIRSCIVTSRIRGLVPPGLAVKDQIWETRLIIGSPDPSVALGQRSESVSVVFRTRVGVCRQ